MTLAELENIDGLFEYYQKHSFRETCAKFGIDFTNRNWVKIGMLYPKNGNKSIKVVREFNRPDNNINSHATATLKRLRKDFGFSRKEIAKYLNLNYMYLSQVERGAHNLTKENIYSLCCLFGVSPSEFFPPTIPV